jgi:hypothetical protein
VKLLLVAVLGIAPPVLVGLWAGRRVEHRPSVDPGVEANARLIGYASLVLLIPLGAEVVTGIRPGLLAHAMIGFLLLPPVLLKLGGVGYRFVRYYAGDPRYLEAGPPQLVLRLIGPALVHVAAYWRRAPELAVADWHRRMGGAGGRRSLVVASLLVGAALVLAMLPFPSPFTPLAGAG